MADALVSGASVRKDVEVQLLSAAPATSTPNLKPTPMNEPVARRVAVRYQFRGSQRELGQTFPLVEDEAVLAEGSIRVHTGIGFRRPGDLRLTDSRLVIISHYFFQPDHGFEFPRGSITSVKRAGNTLTFAFRSNDGVGQMIIEEHFLLPMALASWGSDAPQGL
jgi:hypothetical protein